MNIKDRIIKFKSNYCIIGEESIQIHIEEKESVAISIFDIYENRLYFINSCNNALYKTDLRGNILWKKEVIRDGISFSGNGILKYLKELNQIVITDINQKMVFHLDEQSQILKIIDLKNISPTRILFNSDKYYIIDYLSKNIFVHTLNYKYLNKFEIPSEISSEFIPVDIQYDVSQQNIILCLRENNGSGIKIMTFDLDGKYIKTNFVLKNNICVRRHFLNKKKDYIFIDKHGKILKTDFNGKLIFRKDTLYKYIYEAQYISPYIYYTSQNKSELNLLRID